MHRREPPTNLEELVDRIEASSEESDQVSLDLVMAEVGRRSFGPLLLLAGVLILAPVVGDIPTVPTMVGLLVLLLAVQMLFGRDRFWLPQWLLKRSVDSEKLKRTARKWLRPPARFIDRFLRRRLEVFTGTAGARAIAIACALIALGTPVSEFIPFSANGLGAGVAIFGLALIAHDGLVALIGWIIVALTIGLATYGMM